MKTLALVVPAAWKKFLQRVPALCCQVSASEEAMLMKAEVRLLEKALKLKLCAESMDGKDDGGLTELCCALSKYKAGMDVSQLNEAHVAAFNQWQQQELEKGCFCSY